MNIIFGDIEGFEELDKRYIVLELDTIRYNEVDPPKKAFCLVEPGFDDFLIGNQFIDLHKNLVFYYKQRQWNYCQEAIGHLKGKWRGQLDSFYDDLNQRIDSYKDNDPGPEWDGIIDRIPKTQS